MKRSMRVLCASLMIAFSPLAAAQTGKIASGFANLAGSDANALALVNALRNGTNATLTYTTPPATPGGTPTTTTATYDPPTGRMGWGNVKIALALAQDSLTRAGIRNPTAEQLQAALNGGDVMVKNPDGTTTTTTLKGVLQMRADGMGWGQIAHASGTKLGPVVSGVKPATKVSTTTTTTPTTGTVGVKSVTSPSKGIVTAAGVAPSPSQGKGVSNGNALGRGIVTAGGGAATGVTTAQGDGGGNGNGKDKGNGRGGGG